MNDLDELGKLREYLEDETVKHLIETERDRSAFEDPGCRCVLCVSRHGLLAMMQQVRRSVKAHATVAKLYGKTIAERDAALAAVERVREIHRPTLPGYGPKSCVSDGRAWPCPTVAALDGAPEPEEKP